MTKFYSKTTGGFYDTAVNTSMPSDSVEVSDASYTALINSQASGKIIQSDANGNPVALNAPMPSSAQIAAGQGLALINNGIAITSTAFPSLNATYALTQNTQIDLLGALAYCLAKGSFPGNASTFTFFDAAGAPHVFTTIAEFEAFAEAVASYLDPILNFINSGGTIGALPTSNSVTIA